VSAEPATWEPYPANPDPVTWEMIARAELNVIRAIRNVVSPAMGLVVQGAVNRIEREIVQMEQVQ